MESNSQSLSTDNSDTKAAFRKPSNDAANRKYRRRSPVTGSSSSGSFKRERSSSPVFPRKGDSSVSNFSQRRKDDSEREMNLESGRTQYSRRNDSYKHSDRHSYRSSHGYSKHEDYARADKHADDEEKKYQRPSSQAGRGSRGGNISENMRIENEYNRSRDYGRNTDRYEKYDCSGHRNKDRERGSSSLEDDNFKGKDSLSERTGSSRRHANSYYEGIRSGVRNRHNRERRNYDRSFKGNRNDHVLSHEQSKRCQDDPITARNNSGDLPKDADRSQFKEYDVQKHDDRDKVKYDYGESKRENDQYTKEIGKQFDDRTLAMSGSKESLAKKPKLFSLGEGIDCVKDDKVDESQSSNIKSSKEIFNKMESGQNRSGITTSDLNAAKVAAMKAAELVNRNLVGVGVGVGVMSTEQKKKLLWGNKKSTTSEESAHRWDTALFSDRERQEKFNKLMGVKGEVKVEQSPNSQDNEKQKELQQDLEKQYTAGLRRRDGRTVGLGL